MSDEQALLTLAHEEAFKRYQGDWDPYNEERVDDWGYTECERRAFVAGAQFAAEKLKPRTVSSVAEAEALNDNAVILAKGGHLFRKYDNWFQEGKNAWIRNQWGNHCYPESAETLAYDEWAHFPATVLHEGDEK